jgi:hypothetical protein
MDNATLIGVVGIVVGGIGAATGIMAIGYALVAKGAADEANQIAGDSKNLAGEANNLARESNTIAVDARQLAEEANTYSHRAEARETERHDVHWDGEWEQPGTYVITKRGDDQAHDVKATVTADGEEVIVTADLLTDDGAILVFEFPNVAAAFRAEVRERARRPPAPFGMGQTWGLHAHFVTERVVWTTRLNAPQLHTSDRSLTYFDGFYPD